MPAHPLLGVEDEQVRLEAGAVSEHLQRHRLVDVDGDRRADLVAVPSPAELRVGVLEAL